MSPTTYLATMFAGWERLKQCPRLPSSLLVGAAVLILGIVLVVGGLIVFKYTIGKRLDAFKIEGTEFGRTTDEEGCLKEGFARARKLSKNADILEEVGISDFVSGCLRSSKSTPGFCDAVPSTVKWLAGSDEKTCEKIDVPKELCKRSFSNGSYTVGT